MGYSTDFTGQVEVDPPLNLAEVNYLTKFNDTRRMHRESGPYFVEGTGYAGQGRDADIIEYNDSGPGQPGLWCKWIPTEDGRGIEWDGAEKFYDAAEWMEYLIDHFLKEGAEASQVDDPQFEEFTFDHTVNGIIEAQGEDPQDRWNLVVKDNEVKTVEFELVEKDG